MAHIDLLWVADLPPGVRAATDGVARIWMAHMPLQRQRRSVLAHELEHLRAGHHGCQPPRIERHVRAMAARYLLPSMPTVMDAVVWHGRVCDDAAEDLWVDLATLRARFDHLHTAPNELAYAAKRMREMGHDPDEERQR